MTLALPRLHGIVPPLPTPLHADDSLDDTSLASIIDFQIKAGVHGLWVLGTTARFDLLPDAMLRESAEVAAQATAGRVPLVLNVSDQGTRRTQERARAFDDLPYDYYAALPPWYQMMTAPEITNYFVSLADTLSKPIVIYNAPWICNQLTFTHLHQLASHPRIVGCKDVTPVLSRTQDWSVQERREMNFSYLHGTDMLAISSELGADGFVSSLTNPLPELAAAIWNSTRNDDLDRAFRLQSQFLRIGRTTTYGPFHASLEVIMRKRGFLTRMLPPPLQPVDRETAKRINDVIDEVGVVPDDLTMEVGVQR